MTIMAVTAAQAQAMRRPALQAAVDAHARCAEEPDNTTDAGQYLWFRGDGEKLAAWHMRAAYLRRYCAGCPVLQQCRELALREGDGDINRGDDMVRAGLTTQELGHLAREQEARLAKAAAADRLAAEQRRTVNQALARLTHALKPTGSVQGAREELAAAVAARRASNGWGRAA
ncbi:hypothetical protein DF17_21765 [Streptomyces rimosus]|uniref:Uncharacterized protein n=4 Tax=Streptomyces TaxID=1883 RepID=L8EZZ9_STRR1|nr:hypothetical protein DF17_21765 [Streptomyces rimosus]KUJ35162.1 hypothetical protein ADK46_17100 [Streptomyces rimosus subsp. rimosus]MYT42040.1 hypothetical protein [Streptomyces sp. SID5471]QGY70862.1 hypothetical protein V519_037715 [Streptomyces rimosus R6-500]QST86666.1 hypothetical protein SRIM_041365 [Streptomyces rimosus subsp. rimosus ATCC 10970]